MLKRFFVGLITITLATLSLSSYPVSATNNTIVIDNILALCEYSLPSGNGLDGSGDCDAYSNTQTSANVLGPFVLYVSDHVTLKNLDLNFERSYAHFYVEDGGSLTIDGGHYSSPSCVIWIQYDNHTTPGFYPSYSFITIKSGVFEATLSGEAPVDVPSPVCLLPLAGKVSIEEAENIINNYLPTSSQFVNLGVRTRSMNDMAVSEGIARIDKDRHNFDVEYLVTTAVAVVENEGLGGESDSEPSNEPDLSTELTSEESTEQVIIPKAPNTGIPNQLSATASISISTAISVFFTVVIFTSFTRCYSRRTR